MQKIKDWVKLHKKTSIAIGLVIIFVGYKMFFAKSSTSQATRYVLGTVTRGSIVPSVTGTGQISANNQVDLTSKASGALIKVPGLVGQEMKSGALIAEVDPTDAALQLQSAQISYNDLVTPDESTLLKSENSLSNAQSDLVTAYASGATALGTSFSDMSKVLDGLSAFFTNSSGFLNSSKQNLNDTAKGLRLTAQGNYTDAVSAFKAYTKEFQALTSTPSQDDIKKTLSNAEVAAGAVIKASKSSLDAISYIRLHQSNSSTDADAAYTSATTLLGEANTALTNVTSAENSITTNTQNVAEAQIDNTKTVSGPTQGDILTQQLNVRQKQQAYNDYFIRAPFDGILAKLDVKLGDQVNSGTAIATFITKQKIATISLNEVDVAKIKVGQKATLTFDAIDGLSITGVVATVDLVGTVSQGVVSYNVEIVLDTDDDRIKSGMSTSASIITDTKQDVLTVPNAAIKSSGDTSYVEVLPNATAADTETLGGITSATAPEQIQVQTGLSDDTSTEITGGLTENQIIITRTVAPSTQTTAQAPSLFGGGARTGAGGGGNVRFTGGTRIGG